MGVMTGVALAGGTDGMGKAVIVATAALCGDWGCEDGWDCRVIQSPAPARSSVMMVVNDVLRLLRLFLMADL